MNGISHRTGYGRGSFCARTADDLFLAVKARALAYFILYQYHFSYSLYWLLNRGEIILLANESSFVYHFLEAV